MDYNIMELKDGSTIAVIGPVSYGDNRKTYDYGVRQPDGHLIEIDRIAGAVGKPFSVEQATNSLLSFLLYCAERYRHGDQPLSGAPIAEWAYLHKEELQERST